MVTTDLKEMSATEAIRWVVSAFDVNPYLAERDGKDARRIVHFLDHGITDVDAITTHLDIADILADLPSGYPVAQNELANLGLVGASAWAGDPDNRDAWLAVAHAAATHEAEIQASEHRHDRKSPDRRSRYKIRPHQIVTAFHAAGRGPSYAQRIIASARRHLVEIDAFGFDEVITPAVYDELASAGVRSLTILEGYLRAGLTVAEAVAFRSDGIPAAAVLKAQHEGHPKSSWHELLLGLPYDWFRPLDNHHYDAAEEDERLAYFLSHGGNDRYTLADLRYLVDHGWTGGDSLRPAGVRQIPRYGDADYPEQRTAVTARELADHGLTWGKLEKWAQALTVGKTSDSQYDTNTPALLLGGGRGPAAIDIRHLPEVYDLVAAGIKPSHLASYRRAGCRTIEEVLDAHAAGITAKKADELCKKYGRKPSAYRSTYLLGSLRELTRGLELDLAEDASAVGE